MQKTKVTYQNPPQEGTDGQHHQQEKLDYQMKQTSQQLLHA